MKSNTKQVRAEVQKYILERTNFEGYQDEQGRELLPTAANILKTFYSEYSHEIKRRGEQAAFTEWLKGLPTVLTVEMYHNEVINILINRFKTNTPAKIDPVKSFDYFLNLIYMNVKRMQKEEEAATDKTLKKISRSFKGQI